MITLKISGPQGSGKTKIAELVKAACVFKGFSTQIYDGEKPPKKEKRPVDVQIVVENK